MSPTLASRAWAPLLGAGWGAQPLPSLASVGLPLRPSPGVLCPAPCCLLVNWPQLSQGGRNQGLSVWKSQAELLPW